MKYLILTTLTALWLFLLYDYTLTCYGNYPQVAGWVADPKVVAALEYHGIRFAKSDGFELWFERDGQMCRLFTVAFEKRWEKKSRGRL